MGIGRILFSRTLEYFAIQKQPTVLPASPTPILPTPISQLLLHLIPIVPMAITLMFKEKIYKPIYKKLCLRFGQ